MRVKGLLIIASFGCALAEQADAAASDGLCESLSGLSSTCVETDRGAILAPDAQAANSIAAAMPHAEREFRAYFGFDPGRYLVALGSEARAEGVRLREGALIVLPWLTAEERRAAAATSVRAGIEPRLRAAGLSEAQITAQIESAMERLERVDRQEPSIVAHELGHMWLRGLPGVQWVDGDEAYGTALPDWIDETAAVLMESGSEEMMRSRRDHFARVRDTTPELIMPLDVYFSQDHPLLRSMHRLRPGAAGAGGPQGGPGVRVVSLEESQSSGINVAAGAAFYSQARVFADYLVSRAGAPSVFASITEALARGETMDAWLRASGARWNLPTSVAALEADWRAWIEVLPAPADTAHAR